jgi:hypothetical protein
MLAVGTCNQFAMGMADMICGRVGLSGGSVCVGLNILVTSD